MRTLSRGMVLTLILSAGVATMIARAADQRSSALSDSPVVSAARTFLSVLEPEQRAKANIALTAVSRAAWSNLPPAASGPAKRNGLAIGEMSAPQENAAMTLLRTSLSQNGFDKVMAIVEAEEQRVSRFAPAGSGRKQFYLAILGEPGSKLWMLQFGGHHLAINLTFVDGTPMLAPSHTGADPDTFVLQGRTVRPLGNELDKARGLFNGLTGDQRTAAAITFHADLMLGPGEDGKRLTPEGALAATFNPAQRAALLDLIGEWTRIVRDDAALPRMTEIQSHLSETYFAWATSPGNAAQAYFRIQGPTVVIEFATEEPGHIHTIYRDPTNEYGAKFTNR